MLRRLIARVFWLCSRWTLRSRPAPATPTVLIGAPHTSNWDFVLMLARADRLPAAGAVGRVVLVIAVIVWTAVFVAMLHHAGRTLWASRPSAWLSRADPSA